jgi:hypothetical protein
MLRARLATHESGHSVAAVMLGVPIIRVTIEAGGAYLHRGYYQQQRDLGIEILCILSLAGSEAEKLFFPAGDDGYGDRIDLKTIRDYLQPASELEIIGEITRLRAAARRLVIAAVIRSKSLLPRCYAMVA